MKKTLLFGLFVGIVLVFVGCSQNVDEKRSVDTLTVPVGKDDDVEVEEIDYPVTAEETLVAFFDYLSRGEFGNAVKLFSSDESDWESLWVYSSAEERNDKAKVLENYCKATLTCLSAEVVEAGELANDEYDFVVRFLNSDGTIFVFGPCCGATEDQEPSKDKFDYKVKKVGDVYKVMAPPLYRP